MVLTGEDGAAVYLNGLHDCLTRYDEFSVNVSDPNLSCPVIFDSWSCWRASDPGTFQQQPCPNFPQLGFSPSSKLKLRDNIPAKRDIVVISTLLV